MEGSEYVVLKSGIRLLEKKMAENLIFEIQPKKWERYGFDSTTVLNFFDRIIKAGYVCRNLMSFQADPSLKDKFYPAQSIIPFNSFLSLKLPWGESDIWCTINPSYFPPIPSQPRPTAEEEGWA